MIMQLLLVEDLLRFFLFEPDREKSKNVCVTCLVFYRKKYYIN